MLEALVIVLTVIAVLLLFFSKEMQDVEEPYWSPVLAFVAMMIFFILAFGVMNIDIPYEQYNVTSGQIETGVHVYTGSWELIWFYVGLAFVALVVMLAQIFGAFRRLAERAGTVRVKRKFR